MTPKQKSDFNKMRTALINIYKHYQTPDQISRTAEKQVGLSPKEVLEMAYENIQTLAKEAVKGIKELK